MSEDSRYFYFSFADNQGVLNHSAVKMQGEFDPIIVIATMFKEKQEIPIILNVIEITYDAYETFTKQLEILS
jgi:hypothetical protein